MDSISVTDLKALLSSDASSIALMDVRNPAEAEVAAIPGATLIPLATIESGEALDQVRALAADRRLVVHCKLGGRSARAVEMLADQGSTATNVTGGIDAWS